MVVDGGGCWWMVVEWMPVDGCGWCWIYGGSEWVNGGCAHAYVRGFGCGCAWVGGFAGVGDVCLGMGVRVCVGSVVWGVGGWVLGVGYWVLLRSATTRTRYWVFGVVCWVGGWWLVDGQWLVGSGWWWVEGRSVVCGGKVDGDGWLLRPSLSHGCQCKLADNAWQQIADDDHSDDYDDGDKQQ